MKRKSDEGRAAFNEISQRIVVLRKLLFNSEWKEFMQLLEEFLQVINGGKK